MRFADADVMALENGGVIPPLEVRLDLQPGDKVGLYEEVRHASMGAGFSPIEAVVLGTLEPGWFVGQTEDGREISFHAGNVADVQMGSPSMGGFLDWLKQFSPPMPGAKPAPSSQLPVLPAPKSEEKKGLIAKLKDMFPSSGQSRNPFDIFKKQETIPRGAAGLPVERGTQGLSPIEKQTSMFSILSPESKIIIPFSKQIADLAVPKGPGLLTPYIEKFQEVFKIIPASPEPPPKGPGQTELWASIFKEETEPERPFSEVFNMFTPEEVQPSAEVMPPNIPEQIHRSLKVLPMPRRTSLFPSIEDTARGLMGLYNPISDLWDAIREDKKKPAWKDYVKKYGFAKNKFESIGTCGGPPSVFQELSSMLHIPWEEFRRRAKIVDHGDYEDWVDDSDVWIDIVFPATELMSEAFDLIKPPDLPGTFSFEREVHGNSFCMLLITYTEGEEKEGAYEQWKEDNNAETPEQVVAGLKRDDIDPEKALAQLEKETADLMKQIKDLDKEVGTYQEDFDELTSQVQYRNEIEEEIRNTPKESEDPGEGEGPEELIARWVRNGLNIESQLPILEKEILEIVGVIEEREALAKTDPRYKESSAGLSAALEYRRAMVKAIMEHLNAEPEAKRAPLKKTPKPSKRGKKKGK